MREGRKHGIVTVLSSQYLNSDKATNKEASLDQIGTFCSFNGGILFPKPKKSKANEEENYLNDLYTGEMLASGNIRVHGYPMNYPLKVFVDKFE